MPELSVCASASADPVNRLALMPPPYFKWGYYEKIFLLESPPSEAYLRKIALDARGEIIVSKDDAYLRALGIPSDDVLRGIFVQFRACDGRKVNEEGLIRAFAEGKPNAPFKYHAAAAIFREMGLLSFDGGELKVSSVKTPLEKSAFYRNLPKLENSDG
jgi:hypothetical protein